MLYKLNPVGHKEELKHEEQFGGFNAFPPNWKKITQEEFWGKFFLYNPDTKEYRQMLPEDWVEKKARLVMGELFFYSDGTGIAVVKRDKGEVEYYSFAVCEHEYHELSVEQCHKEGIYHAGMRYHVSRCAKCGHTYSVDSSG